MFIFFTFFENLLCSSHIAVKFFYIYCSTYLFAVFLNAIFCCIEFFSLKTLDCCTFIKQNQTNLNILKKKSQMVHKRNIFIETLLQSDYLFFYSCTAKLWNDIVTLIYFRYLFESILYIKKLLKSYFFEWIIKFFLLIDVFLITKSRNRKITFSIL